jgi:hypothetical protein
VNPLRRHSACALAVLSPLILSGCITIRTPDGHTFTSLTGPSGVRDTLGEPDLIREGSYREGWHLTATSYTYLDRGYSVHLIDGRVVSVIPIPDVQRADYERRAREYKEKTPGLDEPRSK